VSQSSGRMSSPDQLTSTFRRIDALRGFQEVAGQIRSAILSGALVPGDRLPPQRELEKQFGVSRAIVAEALRVLEHSELIVTRPGSRGGSFVQTPSVTDVSKHIHLLVRLRGVSLEELTEFRVLVEGENAYWAAQRGDSEIVKRIGEVVQKVTDLAARESSASIDDLDADFHTLVADAGGNRLSRAIMQGMTSSLRELVRLLPPHPERTAASHMAETYRAIVGREPEAAREAMRRHIAAFSQVLASVDARQSARKRTAESRAKSGPKGGRK
jgi:GntR family transcriptional repressor for pyruvate dehydrogenase complex